MAADDQLGASEGEAGNKPGERPGEQAMSRLRRVALVACRAALAVIVVVCLARLVSFEHTSLSATSRAAAARDYNRFKCVERLAIERLPPKSTVFVAYGAGGLLWALRGALYPGHPLTDRPAPGVQEIRAVNVPGGECDGVQVKVVGL